MDTSCSGSKHTIWFAKDFLQMRPLKLNMELQASFGRGWTVPETCTSNTTSQLGHKLAAEARGEAGLLLQEDNQIHLQHPGL